MQKSKNPFIETWKKTIDLLVNSMILTKEINENEKRETIIKLADDQLTGIYDTRPDKNKLLGEQCNTTQLEFVKYLEKVIATGEL